MNHYTTPRFWELYNKLPANIKKLADKNFEILKKDKDYPSLHFKQIGKLYSVRIGLYYRSLGILNPEKDGIIWFWIGNHKDYDELLKS